MLYFIRYWGWSRKKAVATGNELTDAKHFYPPTSIVHQAAATMSFGITMIDDYDRSIIIFFDTEMFRFNARMCALHLQRDLFDAFSTTQTLLPCSFCVCEILDTPLIACNDLFLIETENRAWFNIQREKLSVQRNVSIHRDDWPTRGGVATHHFNARHTVTHYAHVHYIFISSIIWARADAHLNVLIDLSHRSLFFFPLPHA